MFLEALLTIANGDVSPNATLARRLLQKDVRAFEQFYDRYSRMVHRLLLVSCNRQGRPKRSPQDAFLQLCAQGR